MKRITKKIFRQATGADPVDDDLERANCKKAGEIGHLSCGWCLLHEQPQTICGCLIKHLSYRARATENQL